MVSATNRTQVAFQDGPMSALDAGQNKDIFAVVLGEMQDGGLPHIGCRCERCAAGRVGYAACLAVVDARGEAPKIYLVDATPDIKQQLAPLADWLGPHPARPSRFRQPEALFLTHAHFGHIGGLPQLGPEAMSVEALPVYASPSLIELLRETRLWAPVVGLLDLQPLPPGEPVALADDVTLTALSVPHRDESGTGTYAFRIAGPGQALLYVPDIDDWALWTAARATLADVDVALVDASFYSAHELGGRPPAAHPLVPATLAFFDAWPGRLILTHLNHTNPVLTPGSTAARMVADAGVEVAQFGTTIPL